MRYLINLTVLLVILFAYEAAAKERVDVELVFLADASGSIDEAEIRFQRRGYAEAITHPDLLKAVSFGARGKIAVTYVEWGDAYSQDVVVPWTVVDGMESAAKFANSLMAAPRLAFGPNAIGSAIAVAHGLIEANDLEGTRKIIDFSGDSANNWGGVPVAEARAAALGAGIVINGLAILCRGCNGRPVDYDVEAAFSSYIIGGPGSFVITADKDKSFGAAVRRKFILEIAGGLRRQASR